MSSVIRQEVKAEEIHGCGPTDGWWARLSSVPGYRDGYSTALELIVFHSDFHSTNKCIDDQVATERREREAALSGLPAWWGRRSHEKCVQRRSPLLGERMFRVLRKHDVGRGN